MKKIALSAIAVFGLAGCDVASDVAGDVIAGEVRTRYLEQCQGIAEGAGIASERINAACECSADDFEQDFAADGQLDINPGRVEEVLRMCMQDQPVSDAAAPAEG